MAGLKFIAFALIAFFTVRTAVSADEYYSKFGFWQHDIYAYKQIGASIGPCAAVNFENPEPMKPTAAKLPHYIRLYAECRHLLEKNHTAIGVLRVNDLFLATSCVGVGLAFPGAAVMPECNLKPYLPLPK